MGKGVQYLTIYIAIAAFGFSVMQYNHTNEKDVESRRFEQFHQVFDWVAGRTSKGVHLTDMHQVMAVYQLTEYPEYRHMILPILDHYLSKEAERNLPNSPFYKSLLYTKATLEKAK